MGRRGNRADGQSPILAKAPARLKDFSLLFFGINALQKEMTPWQARRTARMAANRPSIGQPGVIDRSWSGHRNARSPTHSDRSRHRPCRVPTGTVRRPWRPATASETAADSRSDSGTKSGGSLGRRPARGRARRPVGGPALGRSRPAAPDPTGGDQCTSRQYSCLSNQARKVKPTRNSSTQTPIRSRLSAAGSPT